MKRFLKAAALLLLLVTSARAWAQSVNCLPSDIGKVLGMDGKVYTTVSAAGGMSSVSGMIAYVNTSTHEGIAIGPSDLNWNSTEGSGRTSVTNAISSCSGYTRTRPSAATTGWRLPSQADFNNMIGSSGCQSADNLRNMQGRQSSPCGVWAMATDYGYWSSTQTPGGNYYNLWSNNCSNYAGGSNEKYVRPCFTFSVTEPVSYRAYNTGTNTFETLTTNNYTAVTTETTTIGASNTETWYVVNSDVTVSSRITVNGTVHLILCDGATLTADDGIAVTAGNALHIYSQSSGTGQLIADATGLNGSAGIGGGSSVGNITIHGGNITATGGEWSAGIGGGTNGGGGSITIYGGNVEGIGWRVNNNGNAVGIGRGSSGAAVAIQADRLRLQYYENGWQDVTYSQRAWALEKLRVRFFPCTEHSYSDGLCTHCGKHEWCIVTYDGNGNTGGSVPTDNTHYVNDGTGTVTVRGNTGNLVRPTYNFAGWNTAADGSGITYAPGASFTIHGDITLYAQWTPITYTVRFHKNDGSGVYTDQTFTYNSEQALAANTFTRDGWYFVGWSTETNGSLDYTDGQSIINLANEQDAVVNLYALWVQNIYTISYDLAGGTVATPNPTTYHEYSSDITLVNPTKAGYYFVGWTGTGLSEPTMTVTIPTGSTGNRSYTATWIETPLTEDTDEAEGTAARWYVNMPATDTKTVTLSDATVTTFKVYDDGGKNGNYSDDYSGTLVLTAPTGYLLRLSGNITAENSQYDYLTVYDGSDDSGTKLLNKISSTSDGTQTAISTVTSSGQSMTLYFHSDYSNNYAGLNLTVTLFNPNAEYNIDLVVAGNNNTLTASVGGNTVTTAKYNDVVTLTASPASGYLPSDISVVDASGNALSVTDVCWYTGANTASFTMPASAVTVTSTFTNTWTAAGGLYINMPTTGTKTATIPAGVQSFKVYDNGGAGGNYSDNCRGTLVLTAPTGYVLRLSGSISTDIWDNLTVYDGSDDSGTELLNAVSSTSSGTQTAITTVTSTGQSMTLYFYSNNSRNYAGLDLTVTLVSVLELANNADNSDTISQAADDGMSYVVTLADRTLYRDGDWNTLCLPFDLDDFTGTPLEGATVKTLASTDFNDGTLTMNFSNNHTSIYAGVPYIIKWEIRTVDLSTLTADYTAQNGDVLTGTLGGDYKISIAAGATVTLDDVTINGTNNASYEWAGISCVGSATIILKGTNTLKGFYENYPGIYVPSGSTLTIKGSGSLNASSNGWGAGIGGGLYASCGNITIRGGTITATGGSYAAGIGGCNLSCGKITISGGTITATGGSKAAGIGSGGGYDASCGNITITNGVTSVTAIKGDSGNTNSIGAGYNSRCGTVTIGGVVTGNITTSPYTYTGNGTGSASGDIVNPMFKDVTIKNTTANVSTDHVNFVGTYDPITYTSANRSILFLGGGSSLYYPDGTSPITIGACRAYFTLNGITAGEPASGSGIKAFVLNFDGERPTLVSLPSGREEAGAWYSIDGRKLSQKPGKAGIYIHNGKKVAIK